MIHADAVHHGASNNMVPWGRGALALAGCFAPPFADFGACVGVFGPGGCVGVFGAGVRPGAVVDGWRCAGGGRGRVEASAPAMLPSTCNGNALTNGPMTTNDKDWQCHSIDDENLSTVKCYAGIVDHTDSARRRGLSGLS